MQSSTSIVGLGFEAENRNLQLNGSIVTFGEHRYLRIMVPLHGDLHSFPAYFDQTLDKLVKHMGSQTTEIRIVSSNSQTLPFQALLESIAKVRQAIPEKVIRALSAQHIIEYAAREKKQVEHILTDLQRAGVNSIDGRGAGLFFKNFRNHLGARFLPSKTWLNIHRQAHKLGLTSDATMSYGYGEGPKARLRHLEVLRELQDETHGFVSFIPLPNPFCLSDDQTQKREPGYDDLSLIAMARIYLDNFQMIRLPWGRFGLDFCQIGICSGANDLEGALTANQRVPRFKIFRSVDKPTLEHLAQRANYVAQQRTSLRVPQSGNRFKPDSNVDMLLYKVEKGTNLTASDVKTLASKATLFQLGHCGEIIKKRHNISDSTFFSPKLIVDADSLRKPYDELSDLMGAWGRELEGKQGCSVVIDFAAGKSKSTPLAAEKVFTVMQHLVKSGNETSFTLLGVKELWSMAQREKLPFQQLLRNLKALNTVVIEGSSHETEADLTPTEVREMHSAIHGTDIASIAKVELQTPYVGKSIILWDEFIDRLTLLNDVQERTHGLLAVKIEPASRANVSIVEFLKALSIARILLKNVTNIMCTFARTPLIQSRVSSAIPQLSQLAPICHAFGANDSGLVDAQQVPLLNGSFASANQPLSPRDARFFALRA
ncbi:MAG: hypothetical protein AB7T49_06225 [Oligoflexales bacterium]